MNADVANSGLVMTMMMGKSVHEDEVGYLDRDISGSF